MKNFIGNKAYSFELKDQNGETHTLDQYKGKFVLLYFYPKDLTPGCTIESRGFRDLKEQFEKIGAVIIGVSKDDQKSHKKFEEVECLNFPLLSDTEGTMVEHYGLWVEKSMYGKKYMGIKRDSFLIDGDGVIVKHYENVKPEAHPEEVLNDIREVLKKM